MFKSLIQTKKIILKFVLLILYIYKKISLINFLLDWRIDKNTYDNKLFFSISIPSKYNLYKKIDDENSKFFEKVIKII